VQEKTREPMLDGESARVAAGLIRMQFDELRRANLGPTMLAEHKDRLLRLMTLIASHTPDPATFCRLTIEEP
jgi:hypothetical protein